MTLMNLAGVLNPIPTPFDSRGDVDLVRLRAALGRWLGSPLEGVVVLGSTGEAALLDEDESGRVIAAARAAVPADRTFIVGTGRESTRAAIAATTRAVELGADAVLVRTPGFYKSQMTTEAFVRHYTAVADASPVPVLLYNFTAVTGVTIPSRPWPSWPSEHRRHEGIKRRCAAHRGAGRGRSSNLQRGHRIRVDVSRRARGRRPGRHSRLERGAA